jgi:hypothetical protein
METAQRHGSSPNTQQRRLQQEAALIPLVASYQTTLALLEARCDAIANGDYQTAHHLSEDNRVPRADGEAPSLASAIVATGDTLAGLSSLCLKLDELKCERRKMLLPAVGTIVVHSPVMEQLDIEVAEMVGRLRYLEGQQLALLGAQTFHSPVGRSASASSSVAAGYLQPQEHSMSGFYSDGTGHSPVRRVEDDAAQRIAKVSFGPRPTVERGLFVPKRVTAGLYQSAGGSPPQGPSAGLHPTGSLHPLIDSVDAERHAIQQHDPVVAAANRLYDLWTQPATYGSPTAEGPSSPMKERAFLNTASVDELLGAMRVEMDKKEPAAARGAPVASPWDLLHQVPIPVGSSSSKPPVVEPVEVRTPSPALPPVPTSPCVSPLPQEVVAELEQEDRRLAAERATAQIPIDDDEFDIVDPKAATPSPKAPRTPSPVQEAVYISPAPTRSSWGQPADAAPTLHADDIDDEAVSGYARVLKPKPAVAVAAVDDALPSFESVSPAREAEVEGGSTALPTAPSAEALVADTESSTSVGLADASAGGPTVGVVEELEGSDEPGEPALSEPTGEPKEVEPLKTSPGEVVEEEPESTEKVQSTWSTAREEPAEDTQPSLPEPEVVEEVQPSPGSEVQEASDAAGDGSVTEAPVEFEQKVSEPHGMEEAGVSTTVSTLDSPVEEAAVSNTADTPVPEVPAATEQEEVPTDVALAEHPTLDPAAAALASGDWVEKEDAKTGRSYYYNATTKETTWNLAKKLSEGS